MYQATSKVAIFAEDPNVLGFKDLENGFAGGDYETELETQAAILRSDALAMKVIEAMHLDRDPRFTGVAADFHHLAKTQFGFRAWSLTRLE